ncbi:MAG TPA: hypothetical protein VFF72_07905, partial [Caldimonas sp.]|nr:hypothetical protein [Caldimonas sp.]
ADRRIAELMKDRSKLDDEKEFYIGKDLPPQLKARIDANDASLAARRAARVNLVDDRKRIEKNFDDELATLRKHWRTQPNAGTSG